MSQPQQHGDIGPEGTLASLYRTRRRVAGALSAPCESCGAPGGERCMGTQRGFCPLRWEAGVLIASRLASLEGLMGSGGEPRVAGSQGADAVPSSGEPSSASRQAEPERRHPNRHPVRTAPGQAAGVR